MLRGEMRARVIDPVGPAWWRALTLLAALGPVAVALFFGLTPFVVVTMLAAAWMFVARAVLPRLQPRDVELGVEAGVVRIERAGPLSQRIVGRNLQAASVATTARGVSLALVRGVVGDRPLLMELESADEAAGVRRALGIGVRGFGKVSWPATVEPRDGLLAVLQALAALGWFAMAVSILTAGIEVTLGLGLVVVPVTVFAAALGAATDQRRVLPRATTAEREQIAAHERAAAERRAADASGEAPPALTQLVRVAGESSRAWLERIDAMAASFAEEDGYRRSSVHATDLAEAVGDPDAAPPLRAVAARLLARVAPEEARQRIGDALAVERDPGARAGIRVALEEDIDVAARGLDCLGRR